MDLMLFLPFVFFFAIFLRNYNRRGLDVYTYLVSIYAFSAFFSIFVDAMNLYKDFDVFKHPLGLIAPISYCILIYACLYPYKKLNSSKITSFEIVKNRRYNIIVWIYFMFFVFMILVSLTRISEIIQMQAMSQLRDSFYHGDADMIWSSYTGVFRYVIAMSSLLSGSAYILILFFFYNLAVLKKPLWFNIITLLGSVNPLIQSILIADRSGFIHWTLIFILCFVLFHKNLSSKAKKQFSIIGIILIALISTYFFAVTISRFGDGGDIGDTYSSLVYYSGSSYIQYCNFFNVLDYNAPFSLAPLLPLTYWLAGLPGYFEQSEVVEGIYHHGVSNFSTFLGMILSMSGRTVMCIFVVVYYTISRKLLYRRDLSSLSVKKMIYFFIVVLIVNNGLFGYFYMSYSSTCVILIWVYLATFLSNKHKTYKSFSY